jgi:LPS-assembly protein
VTGAKSTATASTPPQESSKTVKSKEPPPAVDPTTLAPGEWAITCPESDCSQSMEGKVDKLHGHPAEIMDSRMLFRADEIVYDGDTEDLHAEGHIYYYNFAKNERIWCDKLDYHTEKGNEHGTFTGHLVGETQPRTISKPGFLTTNAPFHFEGEWAEYDGTRYILHNGWITNCTVPKPWWRLRGATFDIIPRDRAKAYHSEFLLAGVPVFYFPWFYHPLTPEPRKSGFLLPSPGHNSLRGFTLGVGYFWAINRSYDATYRAEVFSSGVVTHHMEFRGAPKKGTDFDVVVFGSSTDQTNSPSGVTLYGVGRSQLGNGWTAGGTLNYTSTLLFRQQWSQSYNEAVGSEIHSSGYLDKSWSTYTFDAVASRTQLFQSVEQQVTDPVTGQKTLVANAVTIRKLPEAQFTSRDHDLFHGLPLWYSFDGSAGLMFRSQPFFDSNNQLTDRFRTSAFTDRIRFAPHLTSAFSIGPVHFVPSIGIEETYYSEAQAPYQDHYKVVGTDLVRSSRDFSLDVIFPSLQRVFPKKTFLGDKLKHVIEPRARYLYVTGVGDDFNRYIRFDENDLRSNTNELEISLANRLYAKRGESVLEVFTWELAQKRYFDPTFGGALIPGQRNIFESTADLTGYAFLVGPRSSSPVVSTIRVQPLNGLSIQWQTDYDHRLHAIVNSTLSADYRWKKFLLSGGNNEVHSSTLVTPYANQFRGRAQFGDTNHRGWNAALDAIYDYRQQVLLYSTTQVTYNTDCCGLSFQFRRVHRVGLADENVYSVAFSVANMGSFGTLKKNDRLF